MAGTKVTGKAGKAPKAKAPAPKQAEAPTNGGTVHDPTPIRDLAKMVADKRAASGTATAPDAPDSATSADTDGGLTQQAKDELAKLAARNGETTSGASVPTGTPDGSSDSEDGVPGTIPGLTEDAPEGGAYAKRQAEIAAARGKSTGSAMGDLAAAKAQGKKRGGKAKPGKPLTEKQQAAADAKAARDAEKKQKEKDKAKADKEKKKETAAAQKKREAAEARKKRDEERKAKLAADKEAKRKERALRLASIPAFAKENAQVKAAFAEDYALAGPKTDKNPNGLGIRRAKADRGDVAAGYVMALRRLRKAGAGTVGGATKAAGAEA